LDNLALAVQTTVGSDHNLIHKSWGSTESALWEPCHFRLVLAHAGPCWFTTE